MVAKLTPKEAPHIRAVLLQLESWHLLWTDLVVDVNSPQQPHLETWVNATFDNQGLTSENALSALNSTYNWALKPKSALVCTKLTNPEHLNYIELGSQSNHWHKYYRAATQNFLLYLERWGVSLPDLLDRTDSPRRLQAWLNAAIARVPINNAVLSGINNLLDLNMRTVGGKRAVLFDPAHEDAFKALDPKRLSLTCRSEIKRFFAYLEKKEQSFPDLPPDSLAEWVRMGIGVGGLQQGTKTAIRMAYPSSAEDGLPIERELPAPHSVEQAPPDASSDATRTRAGSAQPPVVPLENIEEAFKLNWRKGDVFSVAQPDQSSPEHFRVNRDANERTPLNYRGITFLFDSRDLG